MKLQKLLQGVKVLEIHADLAADIQDVAYDSRNVKPGGMFVAIAGFASDWKAAFGDTTLLKLLSSK